MSRGIEPIVTNVHLPAGVGGLDALDFDVRCFLVAYAEGFVLVDVGMAGNGRAIGEGLERIGAGWADVSDIVLTHGHEDHVAGLREVAASAPRARVWAGRADHGAVPADGPLSTLVEGGTIRNLRVLETPGHTAGHCSFVLDDGAVLFAGDVAGSMGCTLSRGPAPFIADPETAERTLRRVAALAFDRVLFGHGAELDDPMSKLRDLARTDGGSAAA